MMKNYLQIGLIVSPSIILILFAFHNISIKHNLYTRSINTVISHQLFDYKINEITQI